MAVKALAGTIVCGAAMLHATVASAQSIAVEFDESAGYSTEDVMAAHTRLHTFGEAAGGLRFYATSVWGKQSEESDAFGAAYPYTDHPVVLDAYAERTFRPAGRLLGLRVGRYRTPFGISSESDQGYVGFLRDPLIRYDDFFALSSTFFEHGADVVVGWPRLSLEASLGASADVGEHTRSTGFDKVLRAQAAAGSFIVGASFIDTRPHLARAGSDLQIGASDRALADLDTPEEDVVAPGRAMFGGVDVRWMRDGVQLRGELIAGRPFDGARTHGGYLDLIVHRPSMGPVTAALRAEHLAHREGPVTVLNGERYVAAMRIRIGHGIIAHLETLRTTGALFDRRPTAFDMGVSYSLRLD
jgi:hypothetical protein